MSLGTRHERSIPSSHLSRMRKSLNIARDVTYLNANSNFHYFQYPSTYNEPLNETDEVEDDIPEQDFKTEKATDNYQRSRNADAYNQQQKFFSTTKRSYTHPEYNSTQQQLLSENKYKLEMYRLHHELQRKSFVEARNKRLILEAQLGLPFYKVKSKAAQLADLRQTRRLEALNGTRSSFQEAQQTLLDIAKVDQAVKKSTLLY